MRTILVSLKLLFSHHLYTALTIFLAIALFITYFVLNNLPVFASDLAIGAGPALLWEVFATQVKMVWEVAGPANIIAVAAVSILASINLSLTLLRRQRSGVWVGRYNFFGIFGAFGGAFGAACNTALISLLGVSGGLAVFPFRGLEISFLAIVLLSVSLYYTSRSLVEFGIVSNG